MQVSYRLDQAHKYLWCEGTDTYLFSSQAPLNLTGHGNIVNRTSTIVLRKPGNDGIP